MAENIIKNKIVKDAEGNIKTITEYDEKGNIIYANGEMEIIKEYDEIGRLIHYKDPTREYWYTYTIDDDGNTVCTFKDDKGYTDITIINGVYTQEK